MTVATLPHHTESRHKFSIGRVVDALISGRQPTGLEAEVDAEMSRRNGQSRGIWVPFDAPIGERRDLTASGSGAGAVQTNYRPTLVDALRARMVLAELGATFWTDLPPGRVQFPNLTHTTSSFTFVAEGSSPSQSAPTLAATVLAPFTLAGWVDCSRSLRQSAGDVFDSLLAEDFSRALAGQIDRVALAGAGSGSNEPDGMVFDGNIPTVSIGINGGALTWAKLCECEETVGANGGEETPNYRGLVTTVKARRALRLAEKVSGSGTIWTDSDTVLGAPAFATSSMPSNGTKGTGTNLSSLLYGADWSLINVGLWGGGIDLLIDPHRFAASGGVRVSCVVGLDVKNRRQKSFCHVVDIVT